MKSKNSRINSYTALSNALACMSTLQLRNTISLGKENHTGIGGTSVQIELENTPIFVKKVPITEYELEPEHFMSTANIFNLPMCYQYGIGSAGFNVWRELASHIMTSNWVITNQCPHFPILYHWRIIPDSNNATDVSYWGSTEKYLEYWENNENIKNRISALKSATTSLVLFLEHVPRNLNQQIKELLTNESEQYSINYLNKINKSFDEVFSFMKQHNFLHMDAHFHNVLADDDGIYLSDFGLALSSMFDLSKAELDFIKDHQNYDRCSFSINLIHSIITSYVGKDNWETTIHEYLANKLKLNIPDKINTILSRNAPIAGLMHGFYRAIQKDKSTKYPYHELNRLLD
ncbi:TPA: hypothetical protein ACGWTM_002984 [Legionella pneumophila]